MSNVYEALRSAYQQIGTPVEQDADIGLVENALVAAGYALSVDAGRLMAHRDNQIVPVEPALRTLALRPENASLFVLPLDRVTKKSQLKTNERKAAFIEKFGLERWQQLCAANK
jgi:hypothetical protein